MPHVDPELRAAHQVRDALEGELGWALEAALDYFGVGE